MTLDLATAIKDHHDFFANTRTITLTRRAFSALSDGGSLTTTDTAETVTGVTRTALTQARVRVGNTANANAMAEGRARVGDTLYSIPAVELTALVPRENDEIVDGTESYRIYSVDRSTLGQRYACLCKSE